MDDLVRQKSHQGLMELHSVSEAPSIKGKTVFINFEFQLAFVSSYLLSWQQINNPTQFTGLFLSFQLTYGTVTRDV